MEPRLGLRLVRGPDWCWGEQDGGEGCVGTVVEVGEGGRSVLVQWDAGTRERCRCGEDDKFDLRVFDAAATGLQFPDVICSGCYVEGVAGIHWQCSHCYKYHLCHSCYLLGRHCQEHPFFRVESKEQAARVKVSCRAGAKRVEAKGVFVGAEVVRGPHWRFGDQDGGAGKTGRVVAMEGRKTATARSIAKVEWSSGGPANIYRVGHKGKVDLCCTTTGSGGYYHPEHLATLGLSAAVTVFNEDNIVAGDLVKVELDPEVFKMMHKAAGLWTDSLSLLFHQAAIVLSVLEQQKLYVSHQLITFMLCSGAVTKLKHCRVGETVRVMSDASELFQLQSSRQIDDPEVFTTAGQIGLVTKAYVNGTIQVYIQGRGWLFNPLCVEPAPGETASYTPDPQNENIAMVNYTTCRQIREQIEGYGIPKALLDGDMKVLENFIYSNQKQAVEVRTKGVLLYYYATMGMIDNLKLILNSGIDYKLFKVAEKLGSCLAQNQTEAAMAMLEAGADVNCPMDNEALTILLSAAWSGNFNIIKAIATSPGILLNVQNSEGKPAVYVAGELSRHQSTAILLAAGADPTVPAKDKSLLHKTALVGSVPVMEVLMVHAKEHMNLKTLAGLAPLHYAAYNGHSRICSLLAAEASVDINVRTSESNSSPLHAAVENSHWSVVECLVGWGAALNPTNNKGNTPLHGVVKLQSPVIPESPQLKLVREELSVASGGRAVEGYIAVACFLVREGADWYIKNKDGVSPHQALPPAMAALIAEYQKVHPGPGMFHSRLRREKRQCKLQELPLPFKAALPPPTSASAPASSAAATLSLSTIARADSKGDDYTSFASQAAKPGVKSAMDKYEKDTGGMIDIF